MYLWEWSGNLQNYAVDVMPNGGRMEQVESFRYHEDAARITRWPSCCSGCCLWFDLLIFRQEREKRECERCVKGRKGYFPAILLLPQSAGNSITVDRKKRKVWFSLSHTNSSLKFKERLHSLMTFTETLRISDLKSIWSQWYKESEKHIRWWLGNSHNYRWPGRDARGSGGEVPLKINRKVTKYCTEEFIHNITINILCKAVELEQQTPLEYPHIYRSQWKDCKGKCVVCQACSCCAAGLLLLQKRDL